MDSTHIITVPANGQYDADALLGVVDYAKHVKAGERTVRTWLAENKLKRARKLNGVWMIPADDRPVESATTSQELALTVQTAAIPIPPQTKVLDALDQATVFLSLEDAAKCLGISQYAIAQHREYFGVVPFGPNGALVVPQGTVRRLAGI